MRRPTRSFSPVLFLAGLLLPVLAQANARLDSQRLNYDRALEAMTRSSGSSFGSWSRGCATTCCTPISARPT
ncbi:hypothetical protein UMZ34_25715 [Halopseudomonas pachastrellae]|nr:hypothetical protein UMZ34_25715 [Halopseudomonas pachastrellae]